jgi:hypothetical protein
MKKYLFYTSAFAAIVLLVPPAFAKGSLAIGKGDAYGLAINIGSYDESDAAALEHCTDECKVVYRFENTCAAYSKEGPEGAAGWAHAPTREEAEKLARDACMSHGGSECPIRVSGCDGN